MRWDVPIWWAKGCRICTLRVRTTEAECQDSASSLPKYCGTAQHCPAILRNILFLVLGIFFLALFSSFKTHSQKSSLSQAALASLTMRTQWESSWCVSSPKNRSLFSVIFKTTLLNVAASSCRPSSLGVSAHSENTFQGLQLRSVTEGRQITGRPHTPENFPSVCVTSFATVTHVRHNSIGFTS